MRVALHNNRAALIRSTLFQTPLLEINTVEFEKLVTAIEY